MPNIKEPREFIQDFLQERGRDLDINEHDSFRDHDMDSLDIIELVMEAEKYYRITITDEELPIDGFNDLEKIITKGIELKLLV